MNTNLRDKTTTSRVSQTEYDILTHTQIYNNTYEYAHTYTHRFHINYVNCIGKSQQRKQITQTYHYDPCIEKKCFQGTGHNFYSYTGIYLLETNAQQQQLQITIADSKTAVLVNTSERLASFALGCRKKARNRASENEIEKTGTRQRRQGEEQMKYVLFILIQNMYRIVYMSLAFVLFCQSIWA